VYAEVFRPIVTINGVPIAPEDAETVDFGAESTTVQALSPIFVLPL